MPHCNVEEILLEVIVKIKEVKRIRWNGNVTKREVEDHQLDKSDTKNRLEDTYKLYEI